MKEIQREPNLPAPTDCFGDEKPMATWYECPHCKKESPLTREWVGFTHEELAWLNEALNLGGRFAVIEAIEAKLKEKNA